MSPRMVNRGGGTGVEGTACASDALRLEASVVAVMVAVVVAVVVVHLVQGVGVGLVPHGIAL